MVDSITNLLSLSLKETSVSKTSSAQVSQTKEEGEANKTMDTVSLHQTSEAAVTYTNATSSEEMIAKGYDMLRQLVVNMLEEQNISYKVSTGSSEIDISELSQQEAQELIADDGYFGIEQTSDRIVDFAIAAAGGDVSRIDAIRQGVEQGFNEALDAFGGSLPEISYNTLDSVMAKLDAWAYGTEEPVS